MDNYAKILFAFHSDILDEWTVETLWAEVVDKEKGYYKLDNIPFYAPVACDDIVLAKYDESEERLVYIETVVYSGNSTIQIIILDNEKDTNTIRKLFEELGCDSEQYTEGYFVINVPAHINYQPVKLKLDQLQKNEVLDYAEPCLSSNHQY